MTASELKAKHEAAQPESHFFARQTMRFFGDTMKNYGVRTGVTVRRHDGSTSKVIELYRRRAVKHGLRDSAYFDPQTFDRIHPARY